MPTKATQSRRKWQRNLDLEFLGMLSIAFYVVHVFDCTIPIDMPPRDAVAGNKLVQTVCRSDFYKCSGLSYILLGILYGLRVICLYTYTIYFRSIFQCYYDIGTWIIRQQM